MKKNVLQIWGILTVVLVIGLAGCGTTNQLNMASMYSIIPENVKNIDGPIHFEHMKIYYKMNDLSSQTVGRLSSVEQNDIKKFFIRLDYNGSSWLYIDTLQLKIDNEETITLKDSSPDRSVISAGQVQVYEVVTFSLSSEIIEKLKICNSIKFQYNTGEPVDIPEKGIIAIKEFVSK